ncbi:MAG: OsmC family protein [Thermodesulfobacteriota bacterium]
MTPPKMVNGIDVDRLFNTIDAIKKKPDIAKFSFRASNRWLEGTHNRASVQGFYGGGQEDTSRTSPMVFDADEPPILLGKNQGANPVEYLLVALSGCVTTSLIINAAAKGVKLDEVESSLEGDIDIRGMLKLDPNIRAGYQQIRFKFKIKSDAPREQLEELVRLAYEASPVYNSVFQGVPIKVELA